MVVVEADELGWIGARQLGRSSDWLGQNRGIYSGSIFRNATVEILDFLTFPSPSSLQGYARSVNEKGVIAQA
jgi:hypothetical protein